MEGTQKSCYDFDHCNSSVAYATADGLLRIWEPTTSKLKHEFLPSAHLSSSCTCLKWRSQKSTATTKKKAKKTRKSVPAETDLESDVISMGTATGNINLYSVSRGEIQAQLTKVHTSTVKDVCWSSDSSHLFSASSDGLLVEWDVSSATHKRKWNSGKGGLSCIALCGQSHMISAGRSITLWNLESLTAEKTFTGHASDIVQLHTIMTDSESESIDSLYVISVALDDRVISLWSTSSTSGSKVKRAKASFILDNEPVSSTVHYDRDLNTLCLAVLTVSGSVEIFEYQLNGAVSKKPIKSSCCLKVTSSGGRLPVLACQLTDLDNLTIMYGTAVCPGFDHVSLNGLKKSELKLKREDPRQSTSVTQVTAVGNIRQPNTDREVTVLTPATEGGKKMGSKKSTKTAGEKRSLQEPEATIEERLALLKGASGDGKSNITGPVESLATLLAQALQSDDNKILNKTLQTNDVKVINTTIRRLPPTCVLPLMKHLTIRLEKYGNSQAGGITAHMSLIKWVRSLLHIHASYLATFGELMERLQRMYTIMENRVTQLGTFTRLQGRLELMLSQVARQKDEVEGAETAAALLTLQDESSEDEMMDDFDMMGANSESEDGYLSADEDDLVK